MRYFVPDIRPAVELPPQETFVEKFGGLPWGIPQSKWPKCAGCGKSQSLVAQFEHSDQRLNLGKPGRILSIFHCAHIPGYCSTWDGKSGANACFVTEPEENTQTSTSLPEDLPPVENEAHVIGWIERDDGIPESDTALFFEEKTFFELPDEVMDRLSSISRLGGVPHWFQGPSDGSPVEDGWRFVGQIDSSLSFFTSPKTPLSWISPDSEKWEGRTHFAQGPNFGEDGLGYVFLKMTNGTPSGWFFWQCI